MLKLYVCGYLDRVQSSRRLDREAQRNVKLMWLTGRLAPDHKTIVNFRKDNGEGIRAACARFVALCRELGLFTQAVAAIDGSKFEAVNTRDKNFSRGKPQKRMAQVEAHIAGYLEDLDTADRVEEADGPRQGRLKEEITLLPGGRSPSSPRGARRSGRRDRSLRPQRRIAASASRTSSPFPSRTPASQVLPWDMTTVENGLKVHRYWDLASCRACAIKSQCTQSESRRVRRWEHEAVIEAVQRRLDLVPSASRHRRSLVENPLER